MIDNQIWCMDRRRKFLKKIGLGFLVIPALGWSKPANRPERSVKQTDVFFTTGFKVSEVTTDRAIVRTRLCGQPYPNPIVHERRAEVFRHPIDFDEEQPVEKMDGAVKGKAGSLRFSLINPDGKVYRTDWKEARSEDDFTVSHFFENLQADTTYQVEIEGRSSEDGISSFLHGQFKTAPRPDQIKRALIVTSTCQYFWSFDDRDRGFRTYDGMRRLDPDLYIQTGDYVYYDKPGPLATNQEKAWHKWHAMDSRPAIRDLLAKVPIYMIKDDHDLLKNDVYPGSGNYGELTYEEGLRIWKTQVPMTTKPYRNLRWGRDLEVWLVEGREYRSPNRAEDNEFKTIWGAEQKAWFTESVKRSDATFKILFTATPVVGPDRDTKVDNHANKTFATEGAWLREYLSAQGNMFVVNGDRHWQYVSRDLKTGLLEFGSGPVSDFHAQGWKEGDVRPEHQYLALRGGFLSIEVSRKNNVPNIAFRHHDVDGRVLNEVRVEKG